jgi:hypothetical protein
VKSKFQVKIYYFKLRELYYGEIEKAANSSVRSGNIKGSPGCEPDTALASLIIAFAGQAARKLSGGGRIIHILHEFCVAYST